MNKQFIMKFPWVWALALAACIVSAFLFAAPVYADTDGTELQITDQPEKLVIQLGPNWAGVEFELKTDTGVYPQPVVVSTEGLLSMELGGSKTYVLSAIRSSVPVPQPDTGVSEQAPVEEPGTPEADPKPEGTVEEAAIQTNDPEGTETAPQDAAGNENLVEGIPNLHLFLFAGGLIASVAGLVVMYIVKKRKNSRDDDDDDYYDDE